MKYFRKLVLILGLILMLLAVGIMLEQLLDKQKASSEPMYVKDVPKFITN